MKRKYTLCTNPEMFGSDTTEEDAWNAACIIADLVQTEFHDVEIIISTSYVENGDDVADVQQYVNDNWADWID